jgi:endonuclease/exonuclease/phosphatase family metal-dependent hydrolase
MVAVLLVSACISENLQAPDGPRFEGRYAGVQPDFDGELRVVTWNIKFSETVDTAIAELRQVEALRDADVLLLQEMDEVGVESIAQSLAYNYVYYPATVHYRTDRNFGVAILSKWPMSDARKLALPHENPVTGQSRIAARALILAGDREVLTYNVHTETVVLSPKRRNEQIEFVVEDIEREDYAHVIVGSDFNTLTPASISGLDERFGRVGLARVSRGRGPTVKPAALGLTLDHVFARGVSVLERGVWAETKASDHYPVWVRLLVE